MKNVIIVNISSSRILDDEGIQQYGDLLKSLVDQAGQHHCLLNFAKVEYLSSAALGKLVVFRKQLEATKGKLALSNIEPTVFEAFKVTGFTRIFKIFDEQHQAYEYLQKQ